MRWDLRHTKPHCTVKALVRKFLRSSHPNLLQLPTNEYSSAWKMVLVRSKLNQKQHKRNRQKYRVFHTPIAPCMKYQHTFQFSETDTEQQSRQKVKQTWCENDLVNLDGRCFRIQKQAGRHRSCSVLNFQQYWFRQLNAAWIIDFSSFLITLCASFTQLR